MKRTKKTNENKPNEQMKTKGSVLKKRPQNK